jgi:hypothetical protein
MNIDNGGVTLDAETDVIETAPNRVLAVMRGSHAPMHCATSDDGGTTWSKPYPVDFVAHSPYLHRATDGTLVLGHRSATLATALNTVVRLSRDNGKTWGDATLIDKKVGAYPSMVNLKDGSVLIVYYEEGDGSNIRAKRFRITAEGIDILPFASK